MSSVCRESRNKKKKTKKTGSVASHCGKMRRLNRRWPGLSGSAAVPELRAVDIGRGVVFGACPGTEVMYGCD